MRFTRRLFLLFAALLPVMSTAKPLEFRRQPRLPNLVLDFLHSTRSLDDLVRVTERHFDCVIGRAAAFISEGAGDEGRYRAYALAYIVSESGNLDEILLQSMAQTFQGFLDAHHAMHGDESKPSLYWRVSSFSGGAKISLDVDGIGRFVRARLCVPSIGAHMDSPECLLREGHRPNALH